METVQLPKNGKKSGVHVNEIDDILSSIEDDLISNNALSKTAALEALRMVLHKCEHNVPSSIFKLTKKYSSEDIKGLVLEQLRTQVCKAVKDSSVKATEVFNLEDVQEDREYVVGMLGEACEGLPTDVLKRLLTDVVIPEMFNVNLDRSVRDTIIDVGFRLIVKFPITNLSSQEIKLFTSRVIERYTKVLEKLREENYNRWHDLWIFLVRFSAKHLHVTMDLANKLLRIVEYAFRNPSYEQRLIGYDCWKELIDNASLDMTHMCSKKQIKLLVTPLRAKFSKMEVVICKRFAVFLYLLEKLQSHSVLCLNEFLEFCFGVSNSPVNSSKNGQGKLVPNLWLKSIQVFLAILGDQTHISSSLNITLFKESVINESNIDRFFHVIVCSVIESSIILKHVSIGDQEKISILSSLWKALFNIIEKTLPDIQERCFSIICSSLSSIFKDFNENLTYIGLFSAFSQLLQSSIDHGVMNTSLELLFEYSMNFFDEKEVSDEYLQQFCNLVLICFKYKNIMEFLVEKFKGLELAKNESKVYEIWSKFGTKLITDPDNHSKLIVQYFLWPVHNLQKFDGKLSSDICSTWVNLYIQVSKSSEAVKKLTINEVEKSFKLNPLLSSNITTLVSAIAHSEIDFNEDFVVAILKLMSSIMSLPLLSQESAEKLYDMILKCVREIANSSNDVDSDVLNNICQCVEKVPPHQKNLPLLEALEKLVDKTILIANSNTKKRLKNIMSNFSGSDVERRASKISTLLSPKETPNRQSPITIKRSVRMTQMACDKSSINTDKNKIDSLQFFGKDIDTMSPLKVKGSVLQNQKNASPSSRSKRIINSVKKQHVPEPPVIEDQSCDFVAIDTQVKLQKDKLTEHQKEEFRRRREDIPALYQDLSQSLSQSQSLITNTRDSLSMEPNPKMENNSDAEKKDNLELEYSRNDSSSINFIEYQTIENIDDEVAEPQKQSVGNFAAFRKLEDNDSNTDSNDSQTKKTNRKSTGRIQKELLRIQMDIVGGDTFLQNLPSKRPRRTLEKVTSVTTPKKSKKIEQEKVPHEEQKVVSTIETEEQLTEVIVTDSQHSENLHNQKPKMESEQEPEQKPPQEKEPPQESEKELSKTIGKRLVKPEGEMMALPELETKKGASDTQITDTSTDTEISANNRKNKFIKPKKHVETPKSDRKKVNPAKPETPTSKRRSKSKEEIKPKKLKLDKTSEAKESVEVNEKIEAPQSEIMFESEIDTEQKKKEIITNKMALEKTAKTSKKSAQTKQQSDNLHNSKEVNLDQNKKTAATKKISLEEPVKNKKKSSKTIQDSQRLSISKEVITQQNSNSKEPIDGNIQIPIMEKHKKRPKEIMKKNKEKVRTIQSQLKLANLNNLSDSSEPKKNKGAKLIFIREITNSKNVKDTKVSPAGLRRNTDKKSKSIAYTIEPPTTSINLESLDLGIKNVQSPVSNSETIISPETKIQKSKRKRRSSGSSSGSSSSPSLSSASETSPTESGNQNNKRSKSKKSKIDVTSESPINIPEIPKKSSTNTPTPPEVITEILESPTVIELNSTEIKMDKAPKTIEAPEVLPSSTEVKIDKSPKNTVPSKKITSVFSPDSPSRVTRSRASLSPMETNQSTSNQINSILPESSKAVKSLFADSEDIIESSQDSIIEKASTSIVSLSRGRPKSPKTQNTSSKHEKQDAPLLPVDDIGIVQLSRSSSLDDENAKLTNISQTATEKSVAQAETETCEPCSEPLLTVVQVELPEKPELTNSEKDLSAAETVSISSQMDGVMEERIDITGSEEIKIDEKVEEDLLCDAATSSIQGVLRPCSPPANQIEFEFIGTPEKIFQTDLPGSPINNVTPTLTRELLDSTLDISPISSQVSDESEKKIENDILKDLEEAIGDSKTSDEDVKSSKPSNDNQSSKVPFALNLRSNKLLNMVNVASPVSHKSGNQKLSSTTSTNSRYEKLFSFFNGNKEDAEKNKKDDLLTCTESVEDILTFSREVPSPLALPSSSILKRKLADTDDGYSPCPKRKRVNFSYPCISSTKLYIRHKEELNSHFRPSYSQNLFGDDDEDNEEDDPFAMYRGETPGSEESMDMTNSLLLCRKKPIYEQLVDCEENLDQLWKRLSSPMYSEMLKKMLKGRNINTIGDLASLNETNINRLPFKHPRVKTVRKALNFYFTTIYKKSKKDSEDAIVCDETPTNGDSVATLDERGDVVEVEMTDNSVPEMIEASESQKMDIRDEFNHVLKRIKNEKISLEEFGSTFLDLFDESEIIDLLKSVYNTDFRKFFGKPHWRYLIETIVHSGGTFDMFDIISDLAENNKVFADQLESIVQLRIDKNPLKDVVSKRSLVELKDALEDCISRDVFERPNVLQTCFIPLIKNPSDIKIYFNTLTMVQINDLFVERVQSSDLTLFFDQIREHYGNYTIAQCANKSDVLKICSKEEILTSFNEKEDEVKVIEDLVGRIGDHNKLIKLYTYIGNLIPVKNRIDAQIEFLKGISLSLDNIQ